MAFQFRNFRIKLTGTSPLLLHQDNFQWADKLKLWRMDPANKGKSVAGDDRSPAFTWLGCLYMDSGHIVVPSDNIMTLMREGGAKCPTGKGQKTFKSQTQSGILVNEIAWNILVDGKTVPAKPFLDLVTEEDYAIHEQTALGHGFTLFAKRARIGNSKHIRVRPRFENWTVQGTVTVSDEAITEQVLSDIMTFSGRYSGLCDWRPSSKQPGSFGMFSSEVEAIK